MTVLTFAAWFSLNGDASTALESRLPAGPMPARVALNALAAIEACEVITDEPHLIEQVVWTFAPLAIDAANRFNVEAALRAAGVYVLSISGTDGKPWLFAMSAPMRRPQAELPYEIEIALVRHVDAGAAAEYLLKEIEKAETDQVPVDDRTRVIPDPRTQKLLFRYTSPVRLEQYLALLAAYDVPPVPTEDRELLKSWRCRYLRADELAERLHKAWDRAPLHVVTHRESNSLLMRVPPQIWRDVEEILQRLDVKQ
ncbi:MAG: hypothetical protein ACKVX7_18260 [Planctomycetota bacterium]